MKIMKLFKRCKHDNLEFVRNLHGAEIMCSGYKRSLWKCKDCGKEIFKEEYYDTKKNKTIDDIKKDLKNGVAVDVAFSPTENISDGYHSFEELYYQRAVLFATICNAFPRLAWKTKKQNDGSNCSKGFFIAGIDTLKGNFTYHCEDKYWDLFKVPEIYKSHWDGHTEKDVTRLLTLNLDK